jgi:hypothetical protein
MSVSFAEVRDLFERKTQARRLDPASFRERYQDRVARYRGRWDREMGEHLGEVPRLDEQSAWCVGTCVPPA